LLFRDVKLNTEQVKMPNRAASISHKYGLGISFCYCRKRYTVSRFKSNLSSAKSESVAMVILDKFLIVIIIMCVVL